MTASDTFSPVVPLWKNAWAQMALLAVLLLLYLLTREVTGPFFPVLIALAIFGIVALEIRAGARSHGWKHEIIDTLKALALALALWFGLGFALQTPSPISAVASCSMLPNLHRGDFVLVQGGAVSAYGISLTPEEFEALRGGVTKIEYNGQTFSSMDGNPIRGSIAAFCQQVRNGTAGGGYTEYPLCREFRKNPAAFSESRGPMRFRYTLCSVAETGTENETRQPCIDRVSYDGKDYPVRLTNDILVYAPKAGDVYALIGDIVHRSYFVLDVDGRRYYLTKGDNNPILDIQAYHYGLQRGNEPIGSEQTKGKVVFRIPFLGYFKLFVSGLFAEDPACRQQLAYPAS